jgi:hypothetical protein
LAENTLVVFPPLRLAAKRYRLYFNTTMLKTIFFILFPLTIFCQTKGFENYTEHSRYESDLNGDKQIDRIVVYEKVCDSLDESSVEGASCRRLAIYLKKEESFVLYGFNDNLIECSKCGGAGVGDPFEDIKIKNQYFSVECLYGACDKTFSVKTFKFDKKTKEFYLYKIGNEDYSCREEDNPNGEIKVKTSTATEKDFGKVKFVDYR